MSEAGRLEYVCLTGPTACGKTELALELAQRVPLEIISMDSALVYRGLDIGTAKPTPEIRSAVPHHLIDILDPTDSYSAGRFARDAGALIDDIRARGQGAFTGCHLKKEGPAKAGPDDRNERT